MGEEEIAPKNEVEVTVDDEVAVDGATSVPLVFLAVGVAVNDWDPAYSIEVDEGVGVIGEEDCPDDGDCTPSSEAVDS